MTAPMVDMFDDDLPLDDSFRVRDDDQASWALRKLRRALDEIDRITAAAEAEHLRIANRKTELCATHETSADRFRAMLTDYYHWLESTEQGVAKTYRLIDGQIARRKGSTTVEVVDEAAFLDWVERTGRTELVRVTTAVDKAAVKAAPFVKDDLGTGITELRHEDSTVPGVVLATKPDTITVTVERDRPL